MRFARLHYELSDNLGDPIQSLAAQQFLPRCDASLDRDFLAEVPEGEPTLVILNGWFSHRPERCLPASETVLPVFTGFHATDHNHSAEYFTRGAPLAYLARHEPVGCRDRATQRRLSEHGIDAFYSKCLTLTFPRRRRPPAEPAIFFVDVKPRSVPLPRSLRGRIVRASHAVATHEPSEVKFERARRLLEEYWTRAGLVVTSRLHCALPCIAMGIPVVFFGDPDDARISPLADLGVPVRRGLTKWRRRAFRLVDAVSERLAARWFAGSIDWEAGPLDVGEEKRRIVETTRALLEKKAGTRTPCPPDVADAPLAGARGLAGPPRSPDPGPGRDA